MNNISEGNERGNANALDGFSALPFKPLRPLRNAHLMTIAASFWRRRFPKLPPPVCRDFQVEPGSKVRAACHWQQNPTGHSTLVLLHGLEGSCDSGYILGTAEQAFAAGFNVLRLNQRNCGGTDELTPTLYHSGLSCDIRAVLLELIAGDRLPELFAAGFSMGGNLVLKMAGELDEDDPPEIRAFVAVAPALDLAVCANALGAPSNFLYEHYFVTRLKRHMRLKARLFPERYPIDGMRDIGSVRDFDEMVTARFCGFANADDYYERSSALRVLSNIRRPTLILAAKDDPFIPFRSFASPAIRENPHIALVATEHGGHCAFISKERENRFWAEGQIVEYCRHQSEIPREADRTTSGDQPEPGTPEQAKTPHER
ncbi:MAG TPA: alpha/beta fold hydrolase [Candidatus Acidoferrum sp.]|nr:alpha/beta fold hydrolase [Candidatus Acidoferrum sp.]